MKKINLKEITEVLSEAELKNVLGGVVTTITGGDGRLAICFSYSKSCTKQSDCSDSQVCTSVKDNPYSPCCF